MDAVRFLSSVHRIFLFFLKKAVFCEFRERAKILCPDAPMPIVEPEKEDISDVHQKRKRDDFEIFNNSLFSYTPKERETVENQLQRYILHIYLLFLF